MGHYILYGLNRVLTPNNPKIAIQHLRFRFRLLKVWHKFHGISKLAITTKQRLGALPWTHEELWLCPSTVVVQGPWFACAPKWPAQCKFFDGTITLHPYASLKWFTTPNIQRLQVVVNCLVDHFRYVGSVFVLFCMHSISSKLASFGGLIFFKDPLL